MKSIILGVIIMLASLWGGAYCMDVFTVGQWQRHPAFFTAVFMFFGGFIIAGSKCLDD